jgi:phosphatidylserine/phosphatidylglycerophosphate/cardiolipin synthase-like enzyme
LPAVFCLLAWTSTASAQEILCDASAENCRDPLLLKMIDTEQIGIDVGVWFFKDDRYRSALIRAKNRGVRIRILMDTRANASYPANGPVLDSLKAAGIPMRTRTAGDILHWKLMIFDGQGVVEWSGANFSPTAFVPEEPYVNYEDEVIYFSRRLLGSFMTMFDDIWTNTQDYANWANITGPLTRVHPTSPVDTRLNFPPKDSYQDRLIPLIDREPRGGLIDVEMYRITMARPVDALIRAAARGVRLRLYLEPNEYANLNRPGNKVQMDRLVAAAQQYPGTIEIRMRAHKGLNHQKTVWLHLQRIVVFGTSNWSDASDDNQLEANLFTDRQFDDPLNDVVFDELHTIFMRKWNNTSPVGATETVAWKTAILPPPVLPDTCPDPKANNYGQPVPCRYPEIPTGGGGPTGPTGPTGPNTPAPGPGTAVLWASKIPTTQLHGNWQRQADAAAGGASLLNPDAGQAKVVPALASPSNFFEATFTAAANTPHHLWIRMRSQNNATSNDSIHVQFSDSVTSAGAPVMRIGTTSSAEVVLQAGASAPTPQGWGWADDGWDAPGVSIYFANSGTHTLRIQQREDGAIVDQIVLSSDTYVSTAPGPRRNDATVLPETTGGGGSTGPTGPTGPTSGSCGASSGSGLLGPGDVLMCPSAAPIVVGDWTVNTDATAATGASLLNPNRGAAKVAAASASPANYFEMPFNATAGVAYRIWMRGKATANSWANDSVYIQFSDSVDANGLATARIGTTGSMSYSLEQCSNCGVQGWGWEDNGWGGVGVMGPLIYFATTGTHTIRIQIREDGLAIDQILLSPDRYKSTSPGLNKNDTTILN